MSDTARPAPALSTVTVCFRNPADLDATLASLAALDENLVEIVVVDGSPGDECADVVREHRVDRYIHERDKGKFDAMNKGVLAATGDAVLMANSGDGIADAAALEHLLGRERSRLASHIVYGDAIRIVGSRRFMVAADPVVGPEQIRTGVFPSHQSTLIPRAFCAANLYDGDMDVAGDTLLMARAFSQLPQVYAPIVIGVFGHGGVSSRPTSWRASMRHYRERIEATRYRWDEKLGLIARLAVRTAMALHAPKLLERWQERSAARKLPPAP
jgi:glycosyltransferase involved in cell wall biosynthesis